MALTRKYKDRLCRNTDKPLTSPIQQAFTGSTKYITICAEYLWVTLLYTLTVWLIRSSVVMLSARATLLMGLGVTAGMTWLPRDDKPDNWKWQATGLDAWASRVKCPARFVSHLHEIFIYIWVVYSFCLFCCLFIIVTWWYIWCIVSQVASKRKYRHVW